MGTAYGNTLSGDRAWILQVVRGQSTERLEEGRACGRSRGAGRGTAFAGPRGQVRNVGPHLSNGKPGKF